MFVILAEMSGHFYYLTVLFLGEGPPVAIVGQASLVVWMLWKKEKSLLLPIINS
jgi:hypothetical protein